MQVSAPIEVDDPEVPSAYAHWVARRLEAPLPKLVVSRMTKSLRAGKVFVDWSQNNPAKTTVAPYSLRARDEPTVSTPLTWDEVAAGGSLRFTSDDVLARVEEHGDLFAGTLSTMPACGSRRRWLPASRVSAGLVRQRTGAVIDR